jgi:adenylylsulfate reductase subunit A
MTNEKLLNICLKKLKIMDEDLESLAAKDLHELLRAWELKHRHRAAECVTQHTLFRKETRWPGYYYRGDVMKVDDENWHVLTVSRRDPETGEYTMEKAPCYHLVEESEQPSAPAETRVEHEAPSYHGLQGSEQPSTQSEARVEDD